MRVAHFTVVCMGLLVTQLASCGSRPWCRSRIQVARVQALLRWLQTKLSPRQPEEHLVRHETQITP